MAIVKCPTCDHDVPHEKKFCGNCGFNMVALRGGESCTGCGASLKMNAKFCGDCGQKVSKSAGMSGAVSDGVWLRGDAEFVKKVDLAGMRSTWGSKKVKVPNGTVCLVVKGGAVVNVLRPGEHTTVGLVENFFAWLNQGIDASFYLVDCALAV